MSRRGWTAAWAISLVCAVGCGEEASTGSPTEAPSAPAATDPEPAPEEAAADPEPPTPATVEIPEPPPPSAEVVAGARERCQDVDARFRQSGIMAEDLSLEGALGLLRRATDPAGRRALGACAYNAGRMAEERLELEPARSLYDTSVEARPNPVVRRRRARLGQRDLTSDPSSAENIAFQLRRADGSPCTSDCEVEVVRTARSGARRLLRAVVVRVTPDDSEDGSLYVAMAGPSGRYQWGPAVYVPPSEMEVVASGGTAEVAFRPLRDGADWDLVVRTQAEANEMCCGGRMEHITTTLTVCRVEPMSCFHAVEAVECEGGPDDPGDTDYEGCDDHESVRIELTSSGIEVPRAIAPAVSDPTLGPTTRVTDSQPWSSLFVADAAEATSE